MNKHKVIVEIEVDAVNKIEAMNKVQRMLDKVDNWNIQSVEKGVINGKVTDLVIEELDLNVRAYNTLKRAGINTVNELINTTEEELLEIRNMGKRVLGDIKIALEENGLKLKE